MGTNCLLNLVMVVIVGNEPRCPLFGHFDRRSILFFGNRAVICIEVDNLLLSHQV